MEEQKLRAQSDALLVEAEKGNGGDGSGEAAAKKPASSPVPAPGLVAQ